MWGNRDMWEKQETRCYNFTGACSGNVSLFPKSTFGKETRFGKKNKFIINVRGIIQAKNVT